MQERLEKLERDLKRMKLYAGALTCFLVIGALSAFAMREQKDGVLRARGLVIVDEAGRERILLGAPIPAAKNRVRTDLQRVEATWGKRFPKQYMDYYKGYRHATNGLLILDANGQDRLALGDSVPDPNIGKRIAPSTGLIINDADGFERSGYGLLKVKDNYRLVLGLDAGGKEGLALFIDDLTGRVGMMVAHGEESLYFGNAPAGDPSTGIPVPLNGLLIKRGSEVRHQINGAVTK
jgi:hypothetical protein